MKWAFHTETEKSKKKKRQTKNPTTTNPYVQNRLTILPQNRLRNSLYCFLLFPSAKSNCGFIGLHSWEAEAMLHETNQMFYLEAGEPKASLLPTTQLQVWPIRHSSSLSRVFGNKEERGREKISPCKVMNLLEQVDLDQKDKILQPQVW